MAIINAIINIVDEESGIRRVSAMSPRSEMRISDKLIATREQQYSIEAEPTLMLAFSCITHAVLYVS